METATPVDFPRHSWYRTGMNIREFTDEQRDIFRSYGIDAVYLFGSQANETADTMSDVDFGIVFSDPAVLDGRLFHINGALYEVLCDVVPVSYLKRRMELGAHDFDIVFLQTVSPRMRFIAATTGQVLYRSSAKAEADFREQAMLEYFDYQHFENIANRSFLALAK